MEKKPYRLHACVAYMPNHYTQPISGSINDYCVHYRIRPVYPCWRQALFCVSALGRGVIFFFSD